MAPINLWACSAVCPFEGKEESLISGRAPSPAGAGAGSALPAEAAQVCQSPVPAGSSCQAPVPFSARARMCQAADGIIPAGAQREFQAGNGGGEPLLRWICLHLFAWRSEPS